MANSTVAKQYASNALANATFSMLSRTREIVTSYTLSVKKARVNIQPGDLIHVRYKGVVPMTGNPRATQPELVYIDVDEDLWVMAVQRNISTSGITTVLTVNTIDQRIKDDVDMLAEIYERTEVQNLSLQAFPFGFQDSSERVIQGGTSPADAQYRAAKFSLQIPNLFTEVIKVQLKVLTRPLYSTTDVGPENLGGGGAAALQYYYSVYPSTFYPSDVSLAIDGIDRTIALGGPWNPSAGNLPIDIELDITEYIVDAAGGLYQDHTLEFTAGTKTGDGTISTSHPTALANVSHGLVEAKILFLGVARAVLPA